MSGGAREAEGAPEVLAEGRFIRMVRRGRWEYIERTRVSGVVVIVAITAAGELVLVEQHRPPVAARVVELPAGLAGDLEGNAGEPLEAAAARELMEETGFRAEGFERLAAGPPGPGLVTEVVTFFRARAPRRVAPGGGDGQEAIEVHVVPLAGLRGWLAARERAGALVDPKIYAGLFLAGVAPARLGGGAAGG